MSVSALASTRNHTAATRFGAARTRTAATVARRGAAIATLCVAVVVAGCSQSDDASSIVRTTTNIAGAGVVGVERDTSQACALPSAPDPTRGSTRTVTHASGVTEVPSDPQRIVVLSTSALDATCALGLWERVVGTVTLAGPHPQPEYLGYGVTEIPGVGLAGHPDLAAIAALDPDLIIGDTPGDASFDALQDIAPTVLVGDNNSWQAEFTALAAGLSRSDAAAKALETYRIEANEAGDAIAASQTQAAVVRFTADEIQVLGEASMAGQVLDDMGVRRPTAQRGTSFELTGDDFERAEGDIIYVMFAGADGKAHGKAVLRGDEWLELGAATDKRVFAVEESIWYGDGLTAAHALVDDVTDSLNGYVTE